MISPGSDPIQDTSYNAADVFTDYAAANDSTPTFMGAEVNGAILTLTYDEELNEKSAPAAGAFTVKAAGSTVSLAATNPVVITDRVVTLTLARAVGSGQTVKVSYKVPSSNPIRDTSGNVAEALSEQRVRNITEDTAGPDLRGGGLR